MSTNARSIAIGSLLAALSAGCLVAFTLVAGNADYPSTSSVVAAQPRSTVEPFTLVARSDSNDNRAPGVRPDAGTDPSVPIVLGTRVENPEPDTDGRDANGKPSRKNGKDTPNKKDRKPGDKDSKEDGAPPQVAKPVAGPPSDSDSLHTPRGHAYGHDKKAASSGSPVPSGASSSHGNGPPAHAQANGHDDGPSHSSSSESGSGPPSHASANGHSGAEKETGPPSHAAANGHGKSKKKP